MSVPLFKFHIYTLGEILKHLAADNRTENKIKLSYFVVQGREDIIALWNLKQYKDMSVIELIRLINDLRESLLMFNVKC